MTEEKQPYSLMMIRNGLAEKTTLAKKKKPLKKISDKLKAEREKEKIVGKPVSKLALDKWFDDIKIKHWGKLGGYYHCMECGSFISYEYARHATAHLLPKKLFKSVATHELNYLILGAGCGCHQMTDRVDKFCQMKVWPEAARRIKEMIPLLPFDELKYLSGQLMTALENTQH